MKQAALTFLTLTFTASAMAQAPGRAVTEKAILANEKAVTAAFSKADSATMQKHLLSDSVSVDPMGIMPVSEMLKALSDIKIEPGWTIDSSKFLWLDDSHVLHMYKWTGKGTVMGHPMPSPTWSSTLWVQRGGLWKAAFHQETSAMAPPPAPAKK